MPYLPTQALWQVDLDGGATAADRSRRPLVPASRRPCERHHRRQPPADAVRLVEVPDRRPLRQRTCARAIRITHQSGQVQTPTVGDERSRDRLSRRQRRPRECLGDDSRDGRTPADHLRARPDVALGVPIWSPDGKWIAFVSSRGNTGLGFGVWLVESRRRQPAEPRPRAASASRGLPMRSGSTTRTPACSTRSRPPADRPCASGQDRRAMSSASTARRSTSWSIARSPMPARRSRFTPRRPKTRRRGCSRGFRRAGRRSGRSSTRRCRRTGSRSRCP